MPSAVPDNVNSAAQSGLQPFLQSVPTDDLQAYGIPAGVEFKDLTLGRYYHIHSVDPESWGGNATLAEISYPTSAWYIEVIYGELTCCLLTVDKINDSLRAVAIGASGLARELAEVEAEYPQSDGYALTLVRVHQATSDLMIAEREGHSEKVIGLESARISLKLGIAASSKHKSWDAEEITAKVIGVLQAKGLR